MDYSSYQQITGVIQEIRRGNSCCTQIITITTDNEAVNFLVSGDTRIIDNMRLRRGMRVAAFYDANLPTPAIYPPQFRAELIVPLRREQKVTLKYFDETLTAEDNSLKLNLSPFTNVETLNGQRFVCTPENSQLLVYYTNTTFSIPPQTTPQRIIVLCPFE